MKKIFIIIIPLILLLSGCSCGVQLGSKVADGGVYRSDDASVTWQHKVFVGKSKKGDVTIDNVNVNRLVFSPLDSKTVYLFSYGSAIYVSDDQGDKWRQFYSGPVTGFALHPTKKDVMYLTASNRLFKTEDGGAKWQEMYIEATPETRLNDVIIDVNASNVIYLVASKGTLLKSVDSGVSWQAAYRFSNEISRLYQNKVGVIYAAMPSKALWRSADGGVTWEDLLVNIKKTINKPGQFRQFTFIPGELDGLIYVTSYGLLKTTDGGKTWLSITLVTPPSAVGINTLAINPHNNKEMFYAINQLIYYSSDGGSTWITKTIPSKKSAAALVIKPDDPKIMYLGLSK